MEKTKYVYIARKNKCHCCVAVCTDDQDRDTAKHVAEFIRDGCYINRQSFQEYRETTMREPSFMECDHDNDGQLMLFQAGGCKT